MFSVIAPAGFRPWSEVSERKPFSVFVFLPHQPLPAVFLSIPTIVLWNAPSGYSKTNLIWFPSRSRSQESLSIELRVYPPNCSQMQYVPFADWIVPEVPD